MKNPDIRKLWKWAFSLQGKWPENQTDLADLLQELSQYGSENCDASLLRGFVAYHFPCQETCEINIENELMRASSDEATSTTAHLYLAHFYFDARRFSDALRELNRVDRRQYEKVGQLWRSLKIRELIISSQLFLKPTSVSINEIVDFASELQSTGAENASIPTELVIALLANKSILSREWSKQEFVGVIRLIRAAIDEIATPSTLNAETELLLA